MAVVPELRTPRLLLRAFILADAPAVQRLAGDQAIASTTLNIPHPYPDGAAEAWIATHAAAFERLESLSPGRRPRGDRRTRGRHAGWSASTRLTPGPRSATGPASPTGATAIAPRPLAP